MCPSRSTRLCFCRWRATHARASTCDRGVARNRPAARASSCTCFLAAKSRPMREACTSSAFVGRTRPELRDGSGGRAEVRVPAGVTRGTRRTGGVSLRLTPSEPHQPDLGAGGRATGHVSPAMRVVRQSSASPRAAAPSHRSADCETSIARCMSVGPPGMVWWLVLLLLLTT